MPVPDRDDRVDLRSLCRHLSEALDRAENEPTKYHLREAYQKVVIMDDEE